MWLTEYRVEDNKLSLVFFQLQFINGHPPVVVITTSFSPKFRCQHIIRIIICKRSLDLRVISIKMAVAKCRVGIIEGPGHNLRARHSSDDR